MSDSVPKHRASLAALTASALLLLTACTYTVKYDTYFATAKRSYPIGPTGEFDPKLERNSHNDPAGYFLAGNALVSIVAPVNDSRGISFGHMPSAAKTQSDFIDAPQDVFTVRVKLRPRTSNAVETSPDEYRVSFNDNPESTRASRWTVSQGSEYWTCKQLDDVIEVQGRGCVLTLIFDGWSVGDIDMFTLHPGQIVVDGLAYKLPMLEFKAGVYDW